MTDWRKLCLVLGVFTSCCMLLGAPASQQQPRRTINIVPRPLKVEFLEGSVSLEVHEVQIVYEAGSEELRDIAQQLAELWKMQYQYGRKVVEDTSDYKDQYHILLTTKNAKAELGKEGYELSITKESITIQAPQPNGVFYGMQSLMQLLPFHRIISQVKTKGEGFIVHHLRIKDKPRYRWRGGMLDVCRHYFPKEFVKKYIDLLAMHKMNTFHWHLTEDQGWRIEIKQYPKLNEISSWRMENGEKYGGYYTQDDVREIVEYARQRYITVVPEIELPGHSVAALAAYPELSCTGGPFEVGTRWGVYRDVYCAGNDKTFEFMENVLSEVVELFPGPYVHIGGDECPKTRWEECPKCQERIKAEGLKDEHELQSYFIKRIEKFLIAKNRKLIGWDEILEGGLAPEATVMSWRGIAGGIAAATQGHDVVMSPNSHCYLDHYQAQNRENEPKAIGGFTSLEKIYAFEPTPPTLSPEQAKHILGAQGNLWTEYIATTEHAEYMLYPRLSALAEVTWSAKELRDWDDFQRRMKTHYWRLDALDVNYRKPDNNEH